MHPGFTCSVGRIVEMISPGIRISLRGVSFPFLYCSIASKNSVIFTELFSLKIDACVLLSSSMCAPPIFSPTSWISFLM